MAPLPPIEIQKAFQPPLFVNTNAIYQMHNDLPRAGYTNDVRVLFNGPKDQSREYIIGVIMTAFFIFLIFFIWSVAILGSKFCCRRKAGFFSGQPPIKPLPPPGYQALDPQRRTPDDPSICQNQQDEITEDNDEIVPIEERTVSEPKDDQENLIIVNPETSAQSSVNHENRQSRHCPTQQEIEAYENGTKSGHRFLRRLRIIIFVAGLAVITSSIVFVVQGIYGIDDALKKGTDGLDKTLVIINSGASLCDSFISAQQALSRNVSEAQQTFRNFSWCPALRDAFILECLNGTIGPNISETIALSNNSVCSTVAAISIPVQEALDAVETVLSRTLTTFLTEIENLRYDLLTMWQGRVLSFSWAFWVSVLFILFLNLLVTYLLIGVVLAWRQRLTQPFTRARSKVVVPLFISVTFCVWLFASIFCIGAVLGADFCIDAPDSKVIEIISTNKDRFTSVVFELLVFYLSSCDATLKPTLTFTTDDGTNLVFEALLAGHDFVSRVQEIDEAQFMTTCGASFSPVASVADYVDAQFHIIFDSVFGTKKLFWCSNINPIYVTMAYDAMCYEGVSGLFKMFVSFFFIVCSSMLMISLRAGWQEDRTVDAPDDLYLTEETTNESTLFHDSTNPSEARLVVPGTQEQ